MNNNVYVLQVLLHPKFCISLLIHVNRRVRTIFLSLFLSKVRKIAFLPTIFVVLSRCSELHEEASGLRARLAKIVLEH